MRFLRPVIAAAALLLPATVRAEPDPVPPAFAGLPPVTFQYYDVHGITQVEIFYALKAAAINEPGHPAAAGNTTWKAAFAWDTQRRPGQCRTRNPRTAMSVTVILPRLADGDRVKPVALAAWQAYYAVIERHEAGHARIAFAHAHDFEAEAQFAGCYEIKDIGQRIVDRITALQVDYDRRTQDGQAQGNIVE